MGLKTICRVILIRKATEEFDKLIKDAEFDPEKILAAVKEKLPRAKNATTNKYPDRLIFGYKGAEIYFSPSSKNMWVYPTCNSFSNCSTEYLISLIRDRGKRLKELLAPYEKRREEIRELHTKFYDAFHDYSSSEPSLVSNMLGNFYEEFED